MGWRERLRRKTPDGPVVRPKGRPGDAPPATLAGLDRGEQVLATACEDGSGHWLVLTTWRVLERTPAGETVLDRPWHLVDTGSWDPDAWALSVTFVDGRQGRRWQLQRLTGPGRVPETFRDRTTASVVLMRVVDLGPRRTARVTVRKVLRTRELREQVILGPGARADDSDLAAGVRAARQELRDQTGMAPLPAPS